MFSSSAQKLKDESSNVSDPEERRHGNEGYGLNMEFREWKADILVQEEVGFNNVEEYNGD